MMPRPIALADFYAAGRGPELERVHWGARGQHLQAIDYYNPDDAHLRHVSFHGFQVVAITPEEVIGYRGLRTAFSTHAPAAAIDCGQSPWFRSFAQGHLGRCSHFQLLFYDELFDVICERLTFSPGSYSDAMNAA
jgi:hypothetical protein